VKPVLNKYFKLRNKWNFRDIGYKAIYEDPIIDLDQYETFVIKRKLFNLTCVEILEGELIELFDLFWEEEFRSSNFSTKIFYFFSVWHTSGMTTSFYDFLKKTKLLQDEDYFRALYDQYLRKKYRKAMAREKPFVDAMWAQVRKKD
jgi:hypothetical protein